MIIREVQRVIFVKLWFADVVLFGEFEKEDAILKGVLFRGVMS